jgi:hypothetical protein
MDANTFPAKYSRWMRSVIALAIREAQQDAAVRAGGPVPKGFNRLPDSFLDAGEEGAFVVAVIAIPSEAEQQRLEQWPNTPAPGVPRFPRLHADGALSSRVAERTGDFPITKGNTK